MPLSLYYVMYHCTILKNVDCTNDLFRLDLVCTLEHRLQSVWYSFLNTQKYLQLKMMMMIKPKRKLEIKDEIRHYQEIRLYTSLED